MANYQYSEEINVSPNDVFSFLTSVENATAVLANIRSTQKIGEEALKEGSRFVQIRSHGGHEVDNEYEVTIIEPEGKFGIAIKNKQINASYVYSLHAIQNGCKITLDADVFGRGIRRPLGWLVGQVMKRKDKELLTKMKRAIET